MSPGSDLRVDSKQFCSMYPHRVMLQSISWDEQVAIFKNEGKVSLHEKTGRELGVPVRDMSLFQRPQHHFSAAPRIAIRDDQILVRTELLRAIVQRDSLILFECKCASASPLPYSTRNTPQA